jgi:hypothetical protein
MPDTQERIIDDLMEYLIAHGPGGTATVFTRFFNLVMRFEREIFLGARHYERNRGIPGSGLEALAGQPGLRAILTAWI